MSILEALSEAAQVQATAASRGTCVLYPPGTTPAPSAPEACVRVEDVESNSLRVHAGPEDLPRILELVRRLDADGSRPR